MDLLAVQIFTVRISEKKVQGSEKREKKSALKGEKSEKSVRNAANFS